MRGYRGLRYGENKSRESIDKSICIFVYYECREKKKSSKRKRPSMNRKDFNELLGAANIPTTRRWPLHQCTLTHSAVRAIVWSDKQLTLSTDVTYDRVTKKDTFHASMKCSCGCGVSCKSTGKTLWESLANNRLFIFTLIGKK